MSTEHIPEQLTLLTTHPSATASDRARGRRAAARPAPAVPQRFRLDDDTRRRGLEHVAEIRRRLEASTTHAAPRPTRRRAA